MDIKALKEYVRLNRRRMNPAENECGSDLRKFNSAMERLAGIDKQTVKLFDMARGHWMENFYHDSIGFSFWAIVCLSLLVYPLIKYYEEGLIITMDHSLHWAMFIAPALLLVAAWGLKTVAHIPMAFWSCGFHIALLVLCLYCGAVRHMKIFGSDMNWIWVFCVAGTVLTLAIRLIEQIIKIAPQKAAFAKECSEINACNQLIEEASALYGGFGSEAEQQLRGAFPQAKLLPREPWFAFQRKFDKKGIPEEEPVLPRVKTDFSGEFKGGGYSHTDTDYESHVEVRVLDQLLGLERIPRQMAVSMIGKGQVYPLFGMDLPEYPENAVYERYVHRWDLQTRKWGWSRTTWVSEEETQSHKTFDSSTRADEMYYFGGARTAEEVAAGMGTPDEMVVAQRYLKEKAAARASIPTRKQTHVERRSWDKKENDRGEETAFIRICTSDGTLLALYSGESKEAIDFSLSYAQRSMGFKLTTRSAPTSPAQKAYMFHTFLNK